MKHRSPPTIARHGSAPSFGTRWRTCVLAFGALTLTMTASAVIGLTSPAANATTGAPSTTTARLAGSSKSTTEPLSDCVGNDCFYSRVSALVVTGPGVNLKSWYFDNGPADKLALPCFSPTSPFPEKISESSSTPFCYEKEMYSNRSGQGVDTRIVFYYEIHTNQGEDTGYYVDGAAFVPNVGRNEESCTIRERVSGKDVSPSSPYTCAVSWASSDPHSIDPEPHFSITMKPVTTIDAKTDPNPTRARDLVLKYCTTDDSPQCQWRKTASSAFVQPKGDRTQVTSVHSTCPPETKESELSYEKKVHIEWSDNIGVKVSAETKVNVFGQSVKASVEAEYSHEVSAGVETSEKVKHFVPEGYRGALYLSAGVVEVQGTVNIFAPDRFYKIVNVIVDFPLSNEYRPPNNQPPIPIGVVDPEYWKCEASQPTYPPSGSPGLRITQTDL
jgi:hypothetical protein